METGDVVVVQDSGKVEKQDGEDGEDGEAATFEGVDTLSWSGSCTKYGVLEKMGSWGWKIDEEKGREFDGDYG
ncbi:uncharacterized protein N7459_005187 [Penicillium hispanicum]|uniref:uncharacterized protein n=1 Tax=Penicillium hispanicum TaxID=1080232 RepID=UPI002541FEDA|nr:uncharacterized protein N7459_005187 [Penicillium hispanicum]KAJ5585387.1 hypothetical protein N7459_005187 [Penicillium hispanicum]